MSGNKELRGAYHVVTAASVLDAEFNVALVVYGRGVGELVRLEADTRGRLGRCVFQGAEDFIVDGTPGMKRRYWRVRTSLLLTCCIFVC